MAEGSLGAAVVWRRGGRHRSGSLRQWSAAAGKFDRITVKKMKKSKNRKNRISKIENQKIRKSENHAHYGPIVRDMVWVGRFFGFSVFRFFDSIFDFLLPQANKLLVYR